MQRRGLGQAFPGVMLGITLLREQAFRVPEAGGVDPAKNQDVHSINNSAAVHPSWDSQHFLPAAGCYPICPGLSGYWFSKADFPEKVCSVSKNSEVRESCSLWGAGGGKPRLDL